jgi:hypothetical protein
MKSIVDNALAGFKDQVAMLPNIISRPNSLLVAVESLQESFSLVLKVPRYLSWCSYTATIGKSPSSCISWRSIVNLLPSLSRKRKLTIQRPPQRSDTTPLQMRSNKVRPSGLQQENQERLLFLQKPHRPFNKSCWRKRAPRTLESNRGACINKMWIMQRKRLVPMAKSNSKGNDIRSSHKRWE